MNRFSYQSKRKPKETPGPLTYNTLTYWKGKKISLNEKINKSNNFLDHISKGITRSMYY